MTTLLRPEVSGLVKPSSSLNLYKSSFFSLLECALGLDFFINVVENFESFVLDTRIAGNGRGLNPISQPKDSVRNGVPHCHSKYHRTLPSSFSSGPKTMEMNRRSTTVWRSMELRRTPPELTTIPRSRDNPSIPSSE